MLRDVWKTGELEAQAKLLESYYADHQEYQKAVMKNIGARIGSLSHEVETLRKQSDKELLEISEYLQRKLNADIPPEELVRAARKLWHDSFVQKIDVIARNFLKQQGIKEDAIDKMLKDVDWAEVTKFTDSSPAKKAEG